MLPGTVQMPEGRDERLNAPPPHKCPRCDSANTKFCYYNNYSRSQPRHFCRACRRYWTEGGALRNVPVGGIRKNKCRRKIVAGGNPATAICQTAAGELEGAVFPDIGGHRGAFRSPPSQPNSPSAHSIEKFFDPAPPPPHASLTLMEDLDYGFIWSGGIAAASSSSCSSPSSHYSCRSRDIGGGGGKETALPMSYWDFWHDIAGVTDAGGGRQAGLPY